MRQAKIGLVVVMALLALGPVGAKATTVALGTNNGNYTAWSITGAGATNATAEQYGAGATAAISVSDNDLSTGTFISGGSAAAFTGFWSATNTFTLPGDATSISLSWNFITAGADDRAIVELNGVILGDYFLSDNTFKSPPLTGAGKFSFTDGSPPPLTAYTYTGVTSGTVTVPASFVLGGTNTLTLLVNNTGQSNLNAPTVTFTPAGNPGDGTYVNLNASVSYEESAVPLPGGAWAGLVMLGAMAMGAAARRRLA